LRLPILAVLAKADRPMTGEEIADELARQLHAVLGMRLTPERGH